MTARSHSRPMPQGQVKMVQAREENVGKDGTAMVVIAFEAGLVLPEL